MILRRNDADGSEGSLKEKKPDGKEVVQSLVERIPEDILERTMVRKKKVAFKEEAEYLGLSQESGEWPIAEEDAEEENLSGECEEWDEDSEKSSDDQHSLCMILAEEKMRHRDRELQTDPSSGTYNSIWINRRCAEVKNLRKLQYQGNRSGSYHATRISEQTWCQKMTGRS